MKNPPILPCHLPTPTLRSAGPYLWYGVTGLLILMLGLLGHSAAARWPILCLLLGWLITSSKLLEKWGFGGIEATMPPQVKIFFCVVLAFLAAFAFWTSRLGLPWPVIIGALLLIDGFANVIASLTDYWRLSMLGHAAGLMICGFGFPFFSKSGWVPLFGGSLLVGGLLASAILYWQVRQNEASDTKSS
ncbi:MAG: hypothetical protein V4819_02895 [Verrucomicrobiota bacterium]